jgi:transcription elongation GreA/GreB family factor
MYDIGDNFVKSWYFSLGNIFVARMFKNKNVVIDRHLVSNYYWNADTECEPIFDALIGVSGVPELTILLYASPKTRMARLKKRNINDPDLEDPDKKDDGYSKMIYFLKKYNLPYVVINTEDKTLDDVKTLVDLELNKMFQFDINISLNKRKEEIKMETKKIKMDKEGFEKFKKQIENLEKELAEARMYKGKTAIFQGDNWHDNPELYQTEARERSLMQQIRDMRDKIENIEIIERNLNSDTIDVGDVVLIETIFDEDDIEEMTLKLVGGDGDLKCEIPEISINSPLGKSIYGKKVLDKTSYKVNENVFNVIIKGKGLEEEKKDTESKGPIRKLKK